MPQKRGTGERAAEEQGAAQGVLGGAEDLAPTQQPCPCRINGPVGPGPSGVPCYAECCAPLHQGDRDAPTAEALMRSRYSAFVMLDEAYLLRTHHPQTRPEMLGAVLVPHWLGLKILDHTEEQDSAEVEFVARYLSEGKQGRLHERSRFRQENGQWFYLDAVPPRKSKLTVPKRRSTRTAPRR
ncbi:MAG: hypothetical protein MRY63_10985 [Neomegalonema sp.]|nr:hypothetical protein [Neomegalonema sp.]